MTNRCRFATPQEAAEYLRKEAAYLRARNSPNHAGWHEDCAELLEAYGAFQRYMNEVLNSGDGVYRP